MICCLEIEEGGEYPWGLFLKTTIRKLRNLTTDKRLYTLPPQQAFAEIYGITFPEDLDSDNGDCFDITPASLSDHNCFVFAVCDGVNIRILASELDYEMENGRHRLQDIAVSETLVSVSEVEEKMSHSKHTKRGYSLYIENWNRSAKKYINICYICGRKGYSPVIEQDDFCSTLENKAIYSELSKILCRLELDELGRCKECARVQDKYMI